MTVMWQFCLNVIGYDHHARLIKLQCKSEDDILKDFAALN